MGIGWVGETGEYVEGKEERRKGQERENQLPHWRWRAQHDLLMYKYNPASVVVRIPFETSTSNCHHIQHRIQQRSILDLFVKEGNIVTDIHDYIKVATVNTF